MSIPAIVSGVVVAIPAFTFADAGMGEMEKRAIVLCRSCAALINKMCQAGYSGLHEGCYYKPCCIAGMLYCRAGYIIYELNKTRKAGSACSRLQVGLQTIQEVFPITACLFIWLINLSESIMSEK
jgi:hypothetical protein